MTVEHPGYLQGCHEEADTLIACHAANAAGNIAVRASDTDGMGILLGMLGRHMANPSDPSYDRLIMECGSGNNRRHIDVSKVASTLESKQEGLAAAIPGLHALTGCDFTTAFYRKGKIKPLNVLEKDATGGFTELFGSLALRDEPDHDKAEEFICALYGMGGIKEVNEARYLKLLRMTGKMDQDSVLADVKRVDCALLPPCAKTVRKKLQRAHYLSILWGRADEPNPADGLHPLKYGWQNSKGYHEPEWYEGPAVPDDVVSGREDNQNTDDPQDDETDLRSQISDDGSSGSEWSDDSDSDIES